jgi:hypothetical protein
MQSEYTIRHYPHGIAIFGSVPVRDLPGLIMVAKDYGYDLANSEISSLIGASLVMTNKTAGKRWVEELT